MSLSLFEPQQPFCSNPSCRLHVYVGDPGVAGSGNWAELDGRLTGRGRYGGRMLCDPCGRLSLAEPELPAAKRQEV